MAPNFSITWNKEVLDLWLDHVLSQAFLKIVAYCDSFGFCSFFLLSLLFCARACVCVNLTLYNAAITVFQLSKWSINYLDNYCHIVMLVKILKYFFLKKIQRLMYWQQPHCPGFPKHFLLLWQLYFKSLKKKKKNLKNYTAVLNII